MANWESKDLCKPTLLKFVTFAIYAISMTKVKTDVVYITIIIKRVSLYDPQHSLLQEPGIINTGVWVFAWSFSNDDMNSAFLDIDKNWYSMHTRFIYSDSSTVTSHPSSGSSNYERSFIFFNKLYFARKVSVTSSRCESFIRVHSAAAVSFQYSPWYG